MDIERVFPHEVFELFGVSVRDTVVVTWGIMLAVTVVAWWGTRKLMDRPGAIQNGLEAAVELVEGIIGELTRFPAEPFLPLVGALGIFLIACNSVSMFPGIGAPTRDANTAAALAAVVFFSVHFYGLRLAGPRRYLRNYVEPSWILLPFNVIGDLTRTLALAIRLFGNILSGEIIAAILLALAGFLVPVPMQIFGLFVGLIQAYVFTLLSVVFIVAGLNGCEPPESVEGGAA